MYSVRAFFGRCILLIVSYLHVNAVTLTSSSSTFTIVVRVRRSIWIREHRRCAEPALAGAAGRVITWAAAAGDLAFRVLVMKISTLCMSDSARNLFHISVVEV